MKQFTFKHKPRPSNTTQTGLHATSQLQDLQKLCQPIASSTDVLAEFSNQIRAHGLVREDANARLLYLGLSTRILATPVPMVVRGESSGGKSGLVNRVLKFFPQSAHYSMTGGSEKALIYFKKPLAHRFLVFGEAHGLSKEQFNYFIRELISSGELRYQVVVPTKGGHETMEVRIKGPVGVLTTTTGNLHPENETRMLSLRIDESPAATRDVLIRLGLEREGARPKKLKREAWIAYQKWLMRQPKKVVIPFASAITSQIPPKALRLRRDGDHLLNLISTHALLHRLNRVTNEDGAVIATIEDYESVRNLVARSMAETVEQAVPKRVRQIVKAVKQLKKAYVSLDEIAAHMDVNKSTASRNFGVAEKAGYLVNKGTVKGHTYRIALGDVMPKDGALLPSVQQVNTHQKLRKQLTH